MAPQTSNNELRTSQRAFTLIELIMVIAIIGILAGIGGPIADRMIHSFTYTIDRRDLVETGEVVLWRLSREVRRLKDQTSVMAATPETYRFVDKDDATIAFTINGPLLLREYNGTTDTLAETITSFTFTYYDDAGAEIVTPVVNPSRTDIKFVGIRFTVSAGGEEVRYETRVKLRNVVHRADLFS